jgi:putative aldouronate transport system permease protein
MRVSPKEIRSTSDKVADVIIYGVLALLTFISIVPILHVVNISFSNPNAVARQEGLFIIPQGFTTAAYEFIFKEDALLNSFQVTIFITVVGTALNLLFTVTAAYVLSRGNEVPGSNIIMIIIVIPMLFGAGIVPGYMLIRSLGLINSLWAMIWPGLVNSFYLILMRNYFQSLPPSLVESARIDGASEFRILFQIILPLSLPSMATIGLFYAVAHWNEFFRGIFYITDPNKWPLQVLLRSVVVQADINELGITNRDLYGDNGINQMTIQAATVVSSIVPIALVYPFLQRFFVKGVVLGAEKG